MHVLLGNSEDSCCTEVFGRLSSRGLPACITASPLAPPARFTWHFDAGKPTSQLCLDDEQVKIAGVLVRGPSWIDPSGWSPEDHAYMQAEMLAATLAWLASLDCPVINRPTADLWYRGRNTLMAWRPLLRRCGLPAPEQLITNDPTQARAFGNRLAADGVDGAVYTPLTSGVGYLVSSEAAWRGLANMQKQSPVCLSEPHGATQQACIVGNDIIWDDHPPSEAYALESRLIRLASANSLDFLELVIAPFRGHYGVVMVEPIPVLEHFAPHIRPRIVDALTALLAPAAAQSEAMP